MTSSQVECFFAAAKYSSFTKAAQHLYMTTAAVSKNVLAMEKELGIVLPADKTAAAPDVGALAALIAPLLAARQAAGEGGGGP